MKKQWDDKSAVNDIRAENQEGAIYLYNKYGGNYSAFLRMGLGFPMIKLKMFCKKLLFGLSITSAKNYHEEM